jgi:hypothetical protein
MIVLKPKEIPEVAEAVTREAELPVDDSQEGR